MQTDYSTRLAMTKMHDISYRKRPGISPLKIYGEPYSVPFKVLVNKLYIGNAVQMLNVAYIHWRSNQVASMKFKDVNVPEHTNCMLMVACVHSSWIHQI